MGWSDTWNDILQGGSPRWKVINPDFHQVAYGHLSKYLNNQEEPASIFCPLAGDDPFVHLLWKRGHAVTSIDLVPAAVAAMRSQFLEGEWTKEESDDGSTICWKHDSGRATLYEGDALQSRPELQGKFDAVYDKDSFGALPKDLRKGFCSRIAEYTKANAIVYIEVKLKENHEAVKDMGPPFSLQREDLMATDTYGTHFDHVEALGEVYQLNFGGLKQTGHILKRL
jgi:hypothetical protein